MNPEETEHQALRSLAAGDRERTISILMDAYGQALYRFCRQMVTDPDLADDVHQRTFVQAYEGLDRFAGRSSLRSWLYGIARHRCLDALKARKRRRRRFPRLAATREVVDGANGPQERAEERTLVRALRRCLGELPARIREPILLRFQEGFTYPQMARLLGDAAATLQARVARALPRLRLCLEELGFDS